MSLVIDVDGVSVNFPLSRPGLHTIKRKFSNMFSKEKAKAPERTVINEISLQIKQG